MTVQAVVAGCPDHISADSVMKNVLQQAKVFEWYIKEYDTKAYIKGTSVVLKKNILLKYAPDIFTFDRKGKETIMEAMVDVHYKAPNHYTQKITALTGTRMNTKDIHDRVMQFLNVNMYNPTSFNDEVLMPFAEGSFKYYTYQHEGVLDTLGFRMHKIRINPKQISPKLITAYAYIVDGVWSVAQLEASGKYEFAEFKVKIQTGIFKDDFLLPVKTELFMRMKLFGNHVDNYYTSVYDYTSVVKYDKDIGPKQKTYDLSEYFNVKTDSIPVIKDSLFWEKNRPAPLSDKENLIYQNSLIRKDTIGIEEENSLRETSWNFTKMIINPKRFQYRATYFRYSGILNPLKVGYSANNGFSYSQQLRLQRSYENSRELGFYPDLGYVFGRKEFYFRLPFEWLYLPQKLGKVSLSLGNGNTGPDSKFINDINTYLKDSTFHFDDLNLEYYRDYYAEFKNRLEFTNGFFGDIGLTYHYREPVISSPPVYLRSDGVEAEVPENPVIDAVDETYQSFAPTISLTWNPAQYYRMERRKKIYVGSVWPTISVQYARGISGVLGGDSDFERLEMDIQQRIPMTALSSFQYYAGLGGFTNSQSRYFVDFTKFTRRNFPESWDDKIGGVFHLLDDYWYYSSDAYVQAHVMYESPFIFLRLFKNASRYVLSERVYASQLYLPKIMPSYTELGYGIGNFIFNVGVFVNFQHLEFQRVGFKFAFELFN